MTTISETPVNSPQSDTTPMDLQSARRFGRAYLVCPAPTCNRIHGHLGECTTRPGRHRTGKVVILLAGLTLAVLSTGAWTSPQHDQHHQSQPPAPAAHSTAPMVGKTNPSKSGSSSPAKVVPAAVIIETYWKTSLAKGVTNPVVAKDVTWGQSWLGATLPAVRCYWTQADMDTVGAKLTQLEQTGLTDWTSDQSIEHSYRFIPPNSTCTTSSTPAAPSVPVKTSTTPAVTPVAAVSSTPASPPVSSPPPAATPTGGTVATPPGELASTGPAYMKWLITALITFLSLGGILQAIGARWIRSPRRGGHA